MIATDHIAEIVLIDASAIQREHLAMKFSDKLYAACELADRWRTAGYEWARVVRTLADRGFYGIGVRGGKVVCYYDGVRFEL